MSLNRIGREKEFSQIHTCLKLGRHLLIEGPVGVGKTFLATDAANSLGRPFFRIDGDPRMTEQKLTGWFDPPSVLKNGFTAASFIEGPLVAAMKAGGILFINELNRLPENVQNVLLPALDERKLQIPRLTEVVAQNGFCVVATQNPKEFIATSALSEALLDRFELLVLDYPPESQEIEMVLHHLSLNSSLKKEWQQLASEKAVRLSRLTRNHPKIRRGASIRAAISIAELTLSPLNADFKISFHEAIRLALPNRIELSRESDLNKSVTELLEDVLGDLLTKLDSDMNPDAEKKSP